jgi:hypothetical protein
VRAPAAPASFTERFPARAAWRRRGDTVARDALWVAACWEAAAEEAERDGLTRHAAECRRRAAGILEAAGLSPLVPQAGAPSDDAAPAIRHAPVERGSRGLVGSWERMR